MDETQLHDLPVAATRLSLTLSTVRGLIARGELGPVVKIGRRILLEDSVLRRFVAERRASNQHQPTAEAIQCVGCRRELGSLKTIPGVAGDLVNIMIPCGCGASGSAVITAAAEQPVEG